MTIAVERLRSSIGSYVKENYLKTQNCFHIWTGILIDKELAILDIYIFFKNTYVFIEASSKLTVNLHEPPKPPPWPPLLSDWDPALAAENKMFFLKPYTVFACLFVCSGESAAQWEWKVEGAKKAYPFYLTIDNSANDFSLLISDSTYRSH